jgi:hypothetical protein
MVVEEEADIDTPNVVLATCEELIAFGLETPKGRAPARGAEPDTGGGTDEGCDLALEGAGTGAGPRAGG